MQQLLVVLLITLAVAAVILLARGLGYLQALELLAYDAYLASRPTPESSKSDVWIVAITDHDIVGGDPTVSDQTLAEALERILAAGPVTIGFDLLRGSPVPPGTANLEQVLARHEEIVVVAGYADRHESARATRKPPPAVVDPARVGFADMDLDPDGVLRRGLLYLSGGEGPGTAFALRLAGRYLATMGIKPRPDDGHLRLGAATYVPLGPNDGGYAGLPGGGYQFLLTFSSCKTGIPTTTIEELLGDAFDPDDLTGKVVLLGNQASEAKDLFTVPLSCANGIDRQIHGVTVHAQIVGQLIAQARGARPLETLAQVFHYGAIGQLAEDIWIWSWAVLGGLAVVALPSGLYIILAALVLSTLLVASTFGTFAALGWWLPVVPPAMAAAASVTFALAYTLGRERQRWAILLDRFTVYVSAKVAELILSDRTGPQELVATVMFADIRGSTAVSERLTETQLLSWLNEYMAVMADLILKYGGTIEKFAGDGVTAAFGSSRSHAGETAAGARAAVDCALAMADALIYLNRTWSERSLPEVGMRVGIHTGLLIVGDLGSSNRKQYSIIGDTANTAARLESYGKDDPGPAIDAHHCRILISRATLVHLDNAYATESVGALTLKGKARPVEVFRVLSGPVRRAPASRTVI